MRKRRAARWLDVLCDDLTEADAAAVHAKLEPLLVSDLWRRVGKEAELAGRILDIVTQSAQLAFDDE
jgi:hypothetical protein